MEHNIQLNISSEVATLTLNRPEVRNAFDIQLIRELTEALEKLQSEPGLRILIFRGAGDHFSAGADLSWMKPGPDQSNDKLLSESLELADLFRKIYECRLVTISQVRGQVLGGANGIIAACDFCLAEDSAVFGLTEVRLGLLPATISPYIIRKTGISKARELMLTGRIFSAAEALNLGLISAVYPRETFNAELNSLINTLLRNGPEALRGVKSLLRSIEDREIDRALSEGTAEVIARFRKSREGQEGINAFLEKRKPSWVKDEQTGIS